MELVGRELNIIMAQNTPKKPPRKKLPKSRLKVSEIFRFLISSLLSLQL